MSWLLHPALAGTVDRSHSLVGVDQKSNGRPATAETQLGGRSEATGDGDAVAGRRRFLRSALSLLQAATLPDKVSMGHDLLFGGASRPHLTESSWADLALAGKLRAALGLQAPQRAIVLDANHDDPPRFLDVVLPTQQTGILSPGPTLTAEGFALGLHEHSLVLQDPHAWQQIVGSVFPTLGITFETGTASAGALTVRKVTPGTAAHRIGLRPGDRLSAIEVRAALPKKYGAENKANLEVWLGSEDIRMVLHDPDHLAMLLTSPHVRRAQRLFVARGGKEVALSCHWDGEATPWAGASDDVHSDSYGVVFSMVPTDLRTTVGVRYRDAQGHERYAHQVDWDAFHWQMHETENPDVTRDPNDVWLEEALTAALRRE